MRYIKALEGLKETLGGAVVYNYGGLDINKISHSFITEENGVEVGYAQYDGQEELPDTVQEITKEEFKAKSEEYVKKMKSEGIDDRERILQLEQENMELKSRLANVELALAEMSV